MTRNASGDARVASEVLELIEDHREAHIQHSDIHSGRGDHTRLWLEIVVREKDD